MSEEKLEPYEAFELFCRENGYADVMDCVAERVDLDRLSQAVEAYRASAAAYGLCEVLDPYQGMAGVGFARVYRAQKGEQG